MFLTTRKTMPAAASRTSSAASTGWLFKTYVGVITSAACLPAFAQLTRATSTLTSISTWMQGIGIAVVTIAVIWAGIKMIFGHAQLKDLGGLFWGAFLIGAAALVASWFTSGTAS